VVANVTHRTSAFADGNAAAEVAAVATNVVEPYVPPTTMEVWGDQFSRLREAGEWGFTTLQTLGGNVANTLGLKSDMQDILSGRP